MPGIPAAALGVGPAMTAEMHHDAEDTAHPTQPRADTGRLEREAIDPLFLDGHTTQLFAD